MHARSDPRIDRLVAALTPPDERPLLEWGEEVAHRRVAAVATLLKPTPDGGLELLLIRRAEREGDVWSGHVALPGGRVDPADSSIVDTAVRETREEIDVDLTIGARLLGALPVLEPRVQLLPPIVVHPFVWLVGDVTTRPNEEVAAVHWMSIDQLRHADQQTEYRLMLPDGGERVVPGISVGDAVLWGMTHRIVETLLEALDP